MVTRRHVRGAIAAVFVAMATTMSGAHEVPVHQELTDLAINYLLTQRPELAACGQPSVRAALREGVTREDDYTLYPIGTFFHHFEPALHDDVNAAIRVDASCSSIEWATEPQLCLATLAAAVVPWAIIHSNDGQVFGDVRHDLVALPGTRDKSEGLEALGRLVHLMQDLTSPAHTQNDAHPHVVVNGAMLGDPSIFEATNITRASFPVAMPTGPLLAFSSIDAAMSALQQYTSSRFPSEKTLATGGAPAHDRVDTNGYLWNGPWRVARIDPATNQIVIDVPVASDQFDQLAPEAIRYSASLINFMHQQSPVCEQSIQVDVRGRGAVTSSPDAVRMGGQDRISCDAQHSPRCDHSFPSGQSVTLTAQPEPGQIFQRWTGACSGAGAGPCTVRMDGVVAHAVGAEFSEFPDTYIGPITLQGSPITWHGTCGYAETVASRPDPFHPRMRLMPDGTGTLSIQFGQSSLTRIVPDQQCPATLFQLSFNTLVPLTVDGDRVSGQVSFGDRIYNYTGLRSSDRREVTGELTLTYGPVTAFGGVLRSGIFTLVGQ